MKIFRKLLFKIYILDSVILLSELIRSLCMEHTYAIQAYTLCTGLNLIISILSLKTIHTYIKAKEKDADSYLDITHPTYTTFELCTLIFNLGLIVITLSECYFTLKLHTI